MNENKATFNQIKYAEDLFLKLGYNPDDYDLERMSRKQISNLINELKEEWEG